MVHLDQALAILNRDRDRVRNANIINFMGDYPIHSVSIAGESVMIKGRSDRDWIYISSTNENEFRILTAELTGNDTCFAIIEDWMLPHLTENRRELWRLSCLRLYLPDSAVVPAADAAAIADEGATAETAAHADNDAPPVVELVPDDAAFIFANYGYAAYTTEAFIAERIKKGPSFGIREDGRLVAWIMTQDDGAMGLLTVLPSYRRHGYGDRITSALIRQLRASGKLPFVLIEEQNHKSMSLALKAGFVPDRRIHWFELEEVHS